MINNDIRFLNPIKFILVLFFASCTVFTDGNDDISEQNTEVFNYLKGTWVCKGFYHLYTYEPEDDSKRIDRDAVRLIVNETGNIKADYLLNETPKTVIHKYDVLSPRKLLLDDFEGEVIIRKLDQDEFLFNHEKSRLTESAPLLFNCRFKREKQNAIFR